VSGLNPEFQLAELEMPRKQMVHIDQVRRNTLPKPKKLDKLRMHADRKGVLELDEHELALAFDGASRTFKLEHGPTTVVVGAVGFDSDWYKLLWLIDGRTIEIVKPFDSEGSTIYADGIAIGGIEVLAFRKALIFFKEPCEWSISIGDDEILRVLKFRKPKNTVRLDYSNNRSIETWIGILKPPPLDDYFFRLFSKLRFEKKAPTNARWFLPRNDSDASIAQTFEERIATMIFAILFREPRANLDHSGSEIY
jgi:hypothetical protein